MAAERTGRYGWRMFFAKIDHWIGQTLFVPPIVKLCQLTRQSQYAVARLFWFMAALDAFYRAETLFWSLAWAAISAVMMVTAARRADQPFNSFRFFRLLSAAALVVDLVAWATTGRWGDIEFWVFVLIAEYATIIRTIPPRETRKPAPRASTAK